MGSMVSVVGALLPIASIARKYIWEVNAQPGLLLNEADTQVQKDDKAEKT